VDLDCAHQLSNATSRVPSFMICLISGLASLAGIHVAHGKFEAQFAQVKDGAAIDVDKAEPSTLQYQPAHTLLSCSPCDSIA